MSAIFFTAIFLATIYAALLIRYRIAWTRMPDYPAGPSNDKAPNPLSHHPPAGSILISVIIPARNEERNIQTCITSLLRQTLPADRFEIIVVDDHSEDNTAAIVKEFTNERIILMSLKDHVSDRINSYKKKAIEIAVAKARGVLILTTDADCIAPPRWLQTIASFYKEKKPAFIAMPVIISEKMSGTGSGFLQTFQMLDFMSLQGITGAVVSTKRMTMCNGANMAYERAAFYDAGGFAGIDNIASGDDMLLMHKIYKLFPDGVLFLKSKDVIISTAAAHSAQQFLQQRIRWASKANKYDDKRILPVLLIVYLFNCLLLLLPIIAIWKPVAVNIFGSYSTLGFWCFLLILKTVAELFFLFPVAKFFDSRAKLFFFPLMQPFHIIYTVIAGWLGKFGEYSWKGRVVK